MNEFVIITPVKSVFYIRAVLKIELVIATARHEAGSNLYFYMKKQIASVVPPSQ
ncbi:MAG: hypothetical protein V1781_09185 [Bacteroidota bacterium]